MQPESPQEPTPLQVQIIAGAVAASTVIYMIVVMLMRVTGSMPEQGFGGVEPALATITGVAFLTAGVLGVCAAFLIRKICMAQLSSGKDTLAVRFRIVLVTMAICESAAILGLVHVLLCGNLTFAWILWGIALGGSILLFPTRVWLESRLES